MAVRYQTLFKTLTRFPVLTHVARSHLSDFTRAYKLCSFSNKAYDSKDLHREWVLENGPQAFANQGNDLNVLQMILVVGTVQPPTGIEQWPLEKRPWAFANQGDDLINVLQKILGMRDDQPKTFARQDSGVLAVDDKSEQGIALNAGRCATAPTPRRLLSQDRRRPGAFCLLRSLFSKDGCTNAGKAGCRISGG